MTYESTKTPTDTNQHPEKQRKPYSGEIWIDEDFIFDDRVIEGLKHTESKNSYLQSTIDRTIDHGYKALQKWEHAVREENWSDTEEYGRELANIYDQIDLLKGLLKDRHGISLAPASFNYLAEEDVEGNLQELEEDVWFNDFFLEDHQKQASQDTIISYGELGDLFCKIGKKGIHDPYSIQKYENGSPEDHEGDFRLIMGGPAEIRNKYRGTRIGNTKIPSEYSLSEKFLEMEQEDLEDERGWRERREDVLG